MKLRRLHIGRLPGIATGFTLTNLDAGLNVVLGPNASGKSSICRAVRALLYKMNVDGSVNLGAEFEDAGGTIEVVLQGSEPRWSRSGQEAKKPPLPDESLVSCFTIQLEDLLSEGATEGEIRKQIARILAGGYDLNAVRDLNRFHTRPLHAKREARELREAEQAYRRARDGYETLQTQEDHLDALRERTKLAGREAARIVTLDTALELLKHRAESAAIEHELSEFSPAMDKLTGDEANRLIEHRSILKGQRARLAELDEEHAAAAEKLKRSRLDEHEPGPAEIEDRRLSLNELRTVEQDRRNADQDLAEARGALSVAIRELGGEPPAGELRITPDSVSRAETGLQETRETDAKLRAIEEQLSLLGSVEVDAAGIERSRQARTALAQWLASPDWTRLPRRNSVPWVLLTWLVSLGLTAVSAWRVHWSLAFLALIVLGAGIPLLRRPAPPPDRRGEARSAFRETGLGDPEEWTEEPVRRRLSELEIEILAGERARDDARRRAQLERTLETTRSRAETTANVLRQLAEELGFDPGILNGSLERWTRLVEAYDGARRRVATLEIRVTGLAELEAKLRSTLIGFLGRFEEAPKDTVAQADQLESHLRRLEARRGEHDDATSTLARAERERSRVRSEILRTEEAIDAVYTGAQLTAGDDPELSCRLELREKWKSAQGRRRGNAEVIRNAEQRLGDEPELLALVAARNEDELRRQRDTAQTLAEERETLAREIVTIETSVERARKGDELETARAALAIAKDRLRERFEEERFAAAAGLLLDEVEQQHVEASRPEVLRRAESWFARFTRNAFALKSHTPRGETFLVRETSTGEDRTPAQLSSGTRMQLFLALRLAFALEAERDREPLPFFLDETLTISDPERVVAIVEALHAFALEQDRQVFYLTAQPHDVRAWGGLDPQPKLIKLHEERRLAASLADPSQLELTPLQEIPDSEDKTPEEYGQLLQVPRLELWDPAERVHLFHLLRDDLRLLERLLNRGIETVGQLSNLLASGEASIFLDPGEQEELRFRSTLVGVFLEACRHGRGKPIDRDVLAGSELSPRKVDDFASLAEELNGDARALLAVIDAKDDERTKRFRRDHREQFEIYLEENGHIVTIPALGIGEIELRMQSAAATDVDKGTTTQEKVSEVTRFLLATAIPD